MYGGAFSCTLHTEKSTALSTFDLFDCGEVIDDEKDDAEEEEEEEEKEEEEEEEEEEKEKEEEDVEVEGALAGAEGRSEGLCEGAAAQGLVSARGETPPLPLLPSPL